LAVATNTGLVTIRELDWAAVDKRDAGSLDNVKHTLFKKLKKAEWIESMVYSPCNNFLAIGSHDNLIYVFDTKGYKEIKGSPFKGHSSFITALDWS